NDAESVSMWQSLGFGPNYKTAYCMAVCPAGEDVIGEYLNSKKEFTDEVVRPLQAKKEPVYVVPGSDAEATCKNVIPTKLSGTFAIRCARAVSWPSLADYPS